MLVLVCWFVWCVECVFHQSSRVPKLAVRQSPVFGAPCQHRTGLQQQQQSAVVSDHAPKRGPRQAAQLCGCECGGGGDRSQKWASGTADACRSSRACARLRVSGVRGRLPPTASRERVLARGGGGRILHPLSSKTAAAAGGLLVQQAWRCWESSSLLCSGAAKGRAQLATVAAERPACRVFACHVLFAELLPGERGGAHRGCTSCHRSRRMCAACCPGS